MGFFKDMKDLGKMADHHGGMPSHRGAMKDIRTMADDRGEREVLKEGTPARAVAKGFPEPVPGEKFAMHIPLTVHPPGGAPPYDVDYVFPVVRMKASLSVGMEIPVKIHPDDPQRIAVQWEAQQGAIAAAGGEMAAVTKAFNDTYAGTADKAMREAMARTQGPAPGAASAGADDSAAKLQKLGQLRDAGLITADEFAEKKAELLREF